MFKRPSVINVSVSGDASNQVLNLTAKELYQSQDNLRAVVDFLSNSIAQLPLKVYVRDGETDRKRDRNSVASKLLWRPNADQTEFEFIRALMVEYFVFGSVYVWVLHHSVDVSDGSACGKHKHVLSVHDQRLVAVWLAVERRILKLVFLVEPVPTARSGHLCSFDVVAFCQHCCCCAVAEEDAGGAVVPVDHT